MRSPTRHPVFVPAFLLAALAGIPLPRQDPALPRTARVTFVLGF